MFAALLLEAEQLRAHEAERRVARHRPAVAAVLLSVRLEDGVVVVRQVQQPRRLPVTVLRQQHLRRTETNTSFQRKTKRDRETIRMNKTYSPCRRKDAC